MLKVLPTVLLTLTATCKATTFALTEPYCPLSTYLQAVASNPQSLYEDWETAIEGCSRAGKVDAVNFVLQNIQTLSAQQKIALFNKAAVCFYDAGQVEAAVSLWRYVLQSTTATHKQAFTAFKSLMRLNKLDESTPINFGISEIQRLVDNMHQPNVTSSQLKTIALKLKEITRRIQIGDEALQLYALGAATRAWNLFILHSETTDEERINAEEEKAELQVVLLP